MSEAALIDIEELRQQQIQTDVLFVLADTEVLLKRYSETRRRHPLAQHGAELRAAMHELHFSARAYDRILRVARTLSDLGDRDIISSDDILEAIQYRSQDQRMLA